MIELETCTWADAQTQLMHAQKYACTILTECMQVKQCITGGQLTEHA